jgi:hypothetical protein
VGAGGPQRPNKKALDRLTSWYATGGGLGEPIRDLDIYTLALELGKNPAELREWDEHDLQALMLVLNARHNARTASAKKFKVPYGMTPEYRYAPFHLSKSDDDE